LNLSSAGVELNEKGGIKVNDEFQTTNPNIYAAGDVIEDKMLEALAGYEGTIAVRNAIKGEHKNDFLNVPQVTFTRPNLTRVGLNSFDRDFDSRTVKMKDIVKAQIIDAEKGLIKMVVERLKEDNGSSCNGLERCRIHRRSSIGNKA
jgi:mercuric reductase